MNLKRTGDNAMKRLKKTILMAIIGLLLMPLLACKESGGPNAKSIVGDENKSMCSFEDLNIEQAIPAQVIGFDNRLDYPASNTIDQDESTFWTTYELRPGDLKYLAYEFEFPIDLAGIEFVNNYQNEYKMGDLIISVSSDSTDGINGTWKFLESFNSDHNPFILGDGTLEIYECGVKWIRLDMGYVGSGASGNSPSFYLSEIYFYESL